MRPTALAVTLILMSSAAAAHLRFPTVRAERWIELRLDEAPIQIGYRVGLGAELAKLERRAADRDGDGEVSVAEGNRALDAKTAELLPKLRICIGRSLDELRCRAPEPRDVERAETEGWTVGPGGHLHFAWTLRLSDSAPELGALRFEDDWQVDGVEISDVTITPPSEIALSSAGEGPKPEGVASAFTWIEVRRGPGPRVISASWPPPRRPNALLSSLAVGALLIGLAVWLRSRRAAPPSG